MMRPFTVLMVLAALPMQLAGAQTPSAPAAVSASPVAVSAGYSSALTPAHQLWYRHPASQLWGDYCTSGNCGTGFGFPSSRSCSVPHASSMAGTQVTGCDQSSQHGTASCNRCNSSKCQCGNCTTSHPLDLLSLFSFVLCSDTHGTKACGGGSTGSCVPCRTSSYTHAVRSSDGAYGSDVTNPPVHVEPASPQPQQDKSPMPAVIMPPQNAVPKKVTIPLEVERSIFIAPVISRPMLRLSDFIKT